jgi:hypothetical protein
MNITIQAVKHTMLTQPQMIIKGSGRGFDKISTKLFTKISSALKSSCRLFSASTSPKIAPPLNPSIQALHDRARSLPDKRTIVLTEGADQRVQRAATLAVEQELCNILVLDDTGKALCNVPPHIQVLNPKDHPNFHQLTEDYCMQRGLKKNKELQYACDSPTYENDMKDAVSACLRVKSLCVLLLQSLKLWQSCGLTNFKINLQLLF